jgi:hypothetical protein
LVTHRSSHRMGSHELDSNPFSCILKREPTFQTK